MSAAVGRDAGAGACQQYELHHTAHSPIPRLSLLLRTSVDAPPEGACHGDINVGDRVDDSRATRARVRLDVNTASVMRSSYRNATSVPHRYAPFDRHVTDNVLKDGASHTVDPICRTDATD